MKGRFTVVDFTHALESISYIHLAFLFIYFQIKPANAQPGSNYGNGLIACRCPLGVSEGGGNAKSKMMHAVLILANVNAIKGNHKDEDTKTCTKKVFLHCSYIKTVSANVAHVCLKQKFKL